MNYHKLSERDQLIDESNVGAYPIWRTGSGKSQSMWFDWEWWTWKVLLPASSKDALQLLHGKGTPCPSPSNCQHTTKNIQTYALACSDIFKEFEQYYGVVPMIVQEKP